MIRQITLLSFFLLSFSSLSAQQPPKCTQSIDSLVNEMLNIISGKAGETRDWTLFRQLFLPSTRFAILNHPSDSLGSPFEMVTVDEFIELMQDQYYQDGFTEYELGKVVNEYNGIANVFQSFYAKDSEQNEGRGVTSYQLVYFDERWWIADVLWTTDSNGVPIPKKYLQN